MKYIMLAAAMGCLLAACSSPTGPTTVRHLSGPAANPTGSNGPMSGQPENTNRSATTTITRGSAAHPTGSDLPTSGQPSNMNPSTGGYTTAPPSNPTGSVGYQR